MSSIRDGLVLDGQCNEAVWPYGPAGTTPRPPDLGPVYQASRGTVIAATLDEVRSSLKASRTVVVGLLMTNSFLYADRPIDYVSDTERTHFFHSVLAVGIDDAAGLLIVKNSWGTTWGDDGYGWLTFDYFEHYARCLLLVS